MNLPKTLCYAGIACLMALATGCARKPAEKAPEKASVTIEPASLRAFSSLPEAAPGKEPITVEKVTLGRMLYYDPRLSKNQKLSCNTCHELKKYGVDNEPTSEGVTGQRGDRNSPTVFNAAIHFAQFWDGRAPDVEQQAKGPVLNPVEMAMPSAKQVIVVLKSMPEYVEAFQKAFPGEKDPVNYDNVGRAIGAFERGLVTPARWDKFLKGDQSALTDEEKAGFKTFVASGCSTCHTGTLLGGSMFQKIGLTKPWPDQSDPGRAKVTKSEADTLMFKVPSLRNVEMTAPYFHNGKVSTLNEAVSKMGEYQVGKSLSPAEVQSIMTWMKSLTGEIPAEYIKEPELPKSTNKTPKPTEGD